MISYYQQNSVSSKQRLAVLREHFHRLVRPMGGSVASPFPQQKTNLDWGGTNGSLFSFLQMAEREVAAGSVYAQSSVARLETALIHLSRHSPEDWVDYAIRFDRHPDSKKSSPFDFFLCRSGVFNYEKLIMRGFCGD